ncbi:MAG: hypothetical protein KIS76_06180 [Pyrinomonadaceae bacterium]|nr:hypothetical protein [Pyrinomonadaceae bacterium]
MDSAVTNSDKMLIDPTAGKGLDDQTQNSAHHIELPEKPVVVIEPSKGWILLKRRNKWMTIFPLYCFNLAK